MKAKRQSRIIGGCILIASGLLVCLVQDSLASLTKATYFQQQDTDNDKCLEFCKYYVAALDRCPSSSKGIPLSSTECFDECTKSTKFSKNGTPQDALARNTLQCRQNHAILAIKEGPVLSNSDHMRFAYWDGKMRCNPADRATRAKVAEGRYGKRMYYNAHKTFNNFVTKPLNLIMAIIYLVGLRGELWTVYPWTEVTGGPTDCSANTTYRTSDGTCNNLNMTQMGALGTPFVRALQESDPHPNPLPTPEAVAAIMKRPQGGDTNPAVLAPFSQLAVAWIQFMTHDWFAHDLSLANQAMAQNTVTHWWDASQVYGSGIDGVSSVRTAGGKLHLDSNDEIDYDSNTVPITGFRSNFWVGLHVFHTIAVREHNWIVDTLTNLYPTMTDDEKYGTARLCVSAALAKIHTVEWTPTLLDQLPLRISMYTNWFGITEAAKKVLPSWQASMLNPIIKKLKTPSFGKYTTDETMFNTSFFITEEFISVYRFHPLLPEYLQVENQNLSLTQMVFSDARKLVPVNTTSKLLKALCSSPARALTLQNYPSQLYNLTVPGRGQLNLAAIDIQRDRERGLPRYNDARRQLLLKPLASFDELTNDPDELDALKSIYTDIEQLDMLVGTLADKERPDGFAFGVVPFHIFVIMASRRIFSDRFFQEAFTPEHYTDWGVEYVNSITLKQILERHFPEHVSEIPDNPFMNWK